VTPFDAKAAVKRVRTEREVELRLLYTVKHQVDPRIKELEQILKGGERG
jgi:hypothetical protein